MQDIHSIGGGGARFFGGGGVDRRVRPNLHHQNNQSLKCPRCDSANTKFCYYNNYNLSQPRHFCKACRRYWTKGGVLRNVPVGGGCRKSTKRSTSKPKQPSSKKSSNSHSSSESSSLTASTAAAKPPPPSTASPSASTPATLLNFPDSRFFNFPVDHSADGAVFTEIGSFTSMMTSANDRSFLGFNMGDIAGTPYRLHQDNEATVVRDGRPEQHQWDQQQQKVEELSAGFFDRTAQIDVSGMENRGNNGGAGTVLDWQGGGDQAIFDLPGTVDQAYWSQTQWPDNDPSLYLP